MPLKMEFVRAYSINKKLTERFAAPGPGDRCKLVNPDQNGCQNQVRIFGIRGDITILRPAKWYAKMELARAYNVNPKLTERLLDLEFDVN